MKTGIKNKLLNGKKWSFAGIIAASAAALCCIVPLIALIAGIGGLASAFAWLEPFRLYLFGFSALALTMAFYIEYRPQKKDIECDCEDGKKKGFFRSRLFLWIATVITLLLFAFPYYSNSIMTTTKVKTSAASTITNIQEAELNIKGMTCEGCETIVDYTLKKQKGVINTKSSYKKGNAIVQYDKSKISPDKLAQAINNQTSYKVINYKIIKEK